MYGILVLCLVLGPMACRSENKTTDSQHLNDPDGRLARDGDYIGCYPPGCLDVDYHAVLSNTATPDTCTATCKEHGFKIAALYNRTECACSCEQTCLAQQMADTLCGIPCRLDLNRYCGGFTGESHYVVKLVNASKSKCSENTMAETDGTERPPTRDLNTIYIAAGIGLATIIVLIILFAFLRKSDRRVVYSPRNHSRRWRAHAPSQDSEERLPNDPHIISHVPQLPPRNMVSSGVESTSQTQIRRDGEPVIAEDIMDSMPVVESNFYHVLTKEDGAEMRRQGLSLATENAFAFADCRSYMDSFAGSAAFIHRQADVSPYPENNEEVEHEMVNNELYAVSKK